MSNTNIKNQMLNELETVMSKMLEVQNNYTKNTIKSFNSDNNLDWLLEDKIIQNNNRFNEIKKPLIKEFYNRFCEELFPIADGNKSIIPSNIEGIKEFK